METLKDKFITINVNGRQKPFIKKVKKIAYESVVELAFGSYEEHPNRVFTVTYAKGDKESKGSMTKGDKVKVIEGMVFNVTATDLA